MDIAIVQLKLALIGTYQTPYAENCAANVWNNKKSEKIKYANNFFVEFLTSWVALASTIEGADYSDLND